MKQPWQYQRELDEARIKAETDYIAKLIAEAYDEGMRRGRFAEKTVHPEPADQSTDTASMIRYMTKGV